MSKMISRRVLGRLDCLFGRALVADRLALEYIAVCVGRYTVSGHSRGDSVHSGK